jgi:hypothetical protein
MYPPSCNMMHARVLTLALLPSLVEAGVRLDSAPAASRANSAGSSTPSVEIEMNPMRGAGKV